MGILKLRFKSTIAHENQDETVEVLYWVCFQNKCLLLMKQCYSVLLSVVVPFKSSAALHCLPVFINQRTKWQHCHPPMAMPSSDSTGLETKTHMHTKCTLVDAKPKWQFMCMTKISHDTRSVCISSGEFTAAKQRRYIVSQVPINNNNWPSRYFLTEAHMLPCFYSQRLTEVISALKSLSHSAVHVILISSASFPCHIRPLGGDGKTERREEA